MKAVFDWIATIWNGGLEHIFEIIGIIATPCSIVWGALKWINSHKPPIITKKHPSSKGVLLVFELSQHIESDVSDDINTLPSLSFLRTPILEAAPLSSYGQFSITKGCFHAEYKKELGRMISITTTRTKDNQLNVPLDNEKIAAHTVANFIDLLNEVGTKLKEQGVKDVHLFYSGPACLACYIGEMTKNNMTLFNYYRDRKMKHYVLLDKVEAIDDNVGDAA